MNKINIITLNNIKITNIKQFFVKRYFDKYNGNSYYNIFLQTKDDSIETQAKLLYGYGSTTQFIKDFLTDNKIKFTQKQLSKIPIFDLGYFKTQKETKSFNN